MVQSRHKLKTRTTVDMLAVGIVGGPASPSSLVLAIPALGDDPPAVGSATRLSQAAARAIAPLITVTGTVRCGGWRGQSAEPVLVHRIRPLVVEVNADAAISAGVLPHAARLVWTRPDLTAEDVISG